MTLPPNPTEQWTPVRKLGFRFMAIYCSLYIFYTLLRFQTIPGLTQLHRFLWPVWQGFVTIVNNNILHIRETLVDPNGSTDTSSSWASQFTMIVVAVIGTVVWTAFDRKRQRYPDGEYWLRTAIRYFIAYFALYYGIIKLFALQMPFPSLSQQSTLLGDLSPTRLAWMFIGASTPYQVFSGVVETAAGLLLLYRRTTTLGLILSAAVFGNVVALNFAYDIPVKIMSAHFVVFSMYLLGFEYRRIFDFFLNKPTAPVDLYTIQFTEKIAKYIRIAAKLAFVYVAIVATLILSVRTYRSQHLVVNTKPIEQGVYDVKEFIVADDSLYADSLKWQDMVLYGVTGSIRTSDPVFEQRYRRGYFSFEVDTLAMQLKMKRNYYDSTYIASLNYKIVDPETLRLHGTCNDRLLNILLTKRKKPYRLAEPNQFHWLQEQPQ